MTLDLAFQHLLAKRGIIVSGCAFVTMARLF